MQAKAKLNLLFLLICIFCHAIALGENHFLLMGSPGAGKGTLTSFLMKNDDFCHLCLGDLLREEIKNGTPIGLIAKEFVEAGELVPKELMMELFEQKFIEALEVKKRVIVDGLVQSEYNISYFDDLLMRLHLENDIYYVYLKITPEAAFDRLLGRWVCEQCGAIFHENSIHDVNCKDCGGNLVKRLDDKNDVIVKRIKRFFESTLPLIDYYRNKNLFFEINGESDLNTLYSEYRQFFWNT